MMKMNYNKVEGRLQDNMAREEDILNDIQFYIDENNMLKDRLTEAGNRISDVEGSFLNVRKEADE
jgi:hypothetical protein